MSKSIAADQLCRAGHIRYCCARLILRQTHDVDAERWIELENAREFGNGDGGIVEQLEQLGCNVWKTWKTVGACQLRDLGVVRFCEPVSVSSGHDCVQS